MRKIILLIITICLTNVLTFGENNLQLSKSGTFLVGVNYWASYSGTHMWRDFKPEIIESDFKQLSENGIKILRIFPLWPDFQPIYQIYSGLGSKKYVSFKDEQPLPSSGAGANGVSEEQLQHFDIVANIAQKYKLKLVVGLITGWMSGQLYVPPALEGKNILTDPEALMWQRKFITTFVNRFKNKESILAWDFGNECNVMSPVDNHYQAYIWSSIISGTIKSEDNTRPILSGMHSLEVQENAKWRIIDQAENADILTTHPYSLWTKYASQDAINSIRTILHGAVETRMYGDIGNKPAMVEETGVMGPMTAGEKEKAAFARSILFTNWAYGCVGTFWWCAYDQLGLNFPPYNCTSVETELGLFTGDRTSKPVLDEFRLFSKFIDNFPFRALPMPKREAVCILTEGQDSWAVAYSSFILAKQAGFDFQFQKAGQEIKDAPLYLLPSVNGIYSVDKNYWNKLLEKVNAGATLYISLNDAYLPTFDKPLGIDLSVNIKRRGNLIVKSILLGDSLNFQTSSERKLIIDAKNATVLASEADGNPVFIKSVYGKGIIYLLTFPLEYNLTLLTGAFDKDQPAYSKIYKQIALPLINERVLTQDNPYVGVTEHSINERQKVIVLVNYTTDDIKISPTIKQGWNVKCLYSNFKSEKLLTIKANDALVLQLDK